MSHTRSPLRARTRATGFAWLATATLVTGLAGAAVQGTTTAYAAPAEDCATPFPIADLQDGDAVEGYTVSKGTTPEMFTGEILGVLEDGIAPGLDMVIADLSSDAIDAAGGIWQGMSGSPVYAENGDLIGAVAYGLSWGPSPIAGITPFEEMDDYLGTAPARRSSVDRPTARKIAASGEVSRSQAEQGFEMLGVSTGVSGVGATRLKKLSHSKRSYFPKSAYAAGRASAATASADDIFAGGNMAASYSFGDINFAGVGTATSVCGGEVVGFGHPFDFTGDTTMSLHPASAIYVQPESLGAPFKVANLGAPVGTVYADHLTGITGVFGQQPVGTDITSSVSFGSRSRTGSTTVTVPDANAAVTFYQLIANHDRVLDAITKGSELQSWTITGAMKGAPFTFSHDDRYTTQWGDLSFESSFELADLVWLLSDIEGLVIDDITVDSAADRKTDRFRIVGNQMKVRGEWVAVSHRKPIKTKPGKLLRLRTMLKSSDGSTTTQRFSFRVPKQASGMRGQIFLTGGDEYYGGDYYYEETPDTFDEVSAIIDGLVRNDVVLADLLFSQGRPYGEDGDYVVVSCEDCRGHLENLNDSKILPPVEQVVGGFKRIKVRVK